MVRYEFIKLTEIKDLLDDPNTLKLRLQPTAEDINKIDDIFIEYSHAVHGLLFDYLIDSWIFGEDDKPYWMVHQYVLEHNPALKTGKLPSSAAYTAYSYYKYSLSSSFCIYGPRGHGEDWYQNHTLIKKDDLKKPSVMKQYRDARRDLRALIDFPSFLDYTSKEEQCIQLGFLEYFDKDSVQLPFRCNMRKHTIALPQKLCVPCKNLNWEYLLKHAETLPKKAKPIQVFLCRKKQKRGYEYYIKVAFKLYVHPRKQDPEEEFELLLPSYQGAIRRLYMSHIKKGA